MPAMAIPHPYRRSDTPPLPYATPSSQCIGKFTVSTQLLWGDASVYECACCKFKLYRVMQLAKENGTTGQNFEIQIS